MVLDCGHPDEPQGEVIVTSGGWCAPVDALYDIEPSKFCSDCNIRMRMIAEIGIDPGRHGKNLRVRRGGFQYPTKRND